MHWTHHVLKGARRGFREARRLVIFVVGVTVALLGVILLFTPGPAFVVIPLGLAILSLEFTWAKRWLNRVRDLASRSPAIKDREHLKEQSDPE